MIRRSLLPLLLVLAPGCALFTASEEARENERAAIPEEEKLEVVDDEGAFDPSEVVRDDIGPESADGRPGDENRSEEEEQGEAEPKGPLAPLREAQEELPDGAPDRVESPAEVEALEEARDDAVENATELSDRDDEVKAKVATNPPPDPLAEPDPPFLTVADVLFDIGLTAALAALCAFALRGILRRPLIGSLAVGTTIAAVVVLFLLVRT